ncbi:hypothetical protein EV691_13415 [Azotobacter chroococcum]|uniref:Uncharacterized protein n=1 Tax=Azotobacter chroococcum TaxID=353 RepID=A0A4R1P6D5_9GAMM|nr:hypothetical protein EV691_13415 [Azotobacter chroococcum]
MPYCKYGMNMTNCHIKRQVHRSTLDSLFL